MTQNVKHEAIYVSQAVYVSQKLEMLRNGSNDNIIDQIRSDIAKMQTQIDALSGVNISFSINNAQKRQEIKQLENESKSQKAELDKNARINSINKINRQLLFQFDKKVRKQEKKVKKAKKDSKASNEKAEKAKKEKQILKKQVEQLRNKNSKLKKENASLKKEKDYPK